jgi:hypothetical protein
MKRSITLVGVLAIAVLASLALSGSAWAGTKYTGIVQFSGCNWQSCSQYATALAKRNDGYVVQTNVYWSGALWVYTFECGVNGFGAGSWQFQVTNCNCGRESNWSNYYYIDCNSCSPLPECGPPFKLNICDNQIPTC